MCVWGVWVNVCEGGRRESRIGGWLQRMIPVLLCVCMRACVCTCMKERDLDYQQLSLSCCFVLFSSFLSFFPISLLLPPPPSHSLKHTRAHVNTCVCAHTHTSLKPLARERLGRHDRKACDLARVIWLS